MVYRHNCCSIDCRALPEQPSLAPSAHASTMLVCRAFALLAYLEVEVPRLLGKAQAGLFARVRGVVKFQAEPTAQQVSLRNTALCVQYTPPVAQAQSAGCVACRPSLCTL